METPSPRPHQALYCLTGGTGLAPESTSAFFRAAEDRTDKTREVAKEKRDNKDKKAVKKATREAAKKDRARTLKEMRDDGVGLGPQMGWLFGARKTRKNGVDVTRKVGEQNNNDAMMTGALQQNDDITAGHDGANDIREENSQEADDGAQIADAENGNEADRNRAATNDDDGGAETSEKDGAQATSLAPDSEQVRKECGEALDAEEDVAEIDSSNGLISNKELAPITDDARRDSEAEAESVTFPEPESKSRSQSPQPRIPSPPAPEADAHPDANPPPRPPCPRPPPNSPTGHSVSRNPSISSQPAPEADAHPDPNPRPRPSCPPPPPNSPTGHSVSRNPLPIFQFSTGAEFRAPLQLCASPILESDANPSGVQSPTPPRPSSPSSASPDISPANEYPSGLRPPTPIPGRPPTPKPAPSSPQTPGSHSRASTPHPSTPSLDFSVPDVTPTSAVSSPSLSLKAHQPTPQGYQQNQDISSTGAVDDEEYQRDLRRFLAELDLFTRREFEAGSAFAIASSPPYRILSIPRDSRRSSVTIGGDDGQPHLGDYFD